MSERWHPPTLGDTVVKDHTKTKADRMAELTRALLAGENVSGKVRCACRRLVSRDVMIDLSGVSAETREAWGVVGEAICDGCYTRLLRRGVFTRAEFCEALGAPTELVEALVAKDQADS